MNENEKQQFTISPVQSALRQYAIYLLIAATFITVVNVTLIILPTEEVHILLFLPFLSLLFTGPYLFLLLMAMRTKVSPRARLLYAIAATFLPIPGLIETSGRMLLGTPIYQMGDMCMYQYTAALSVVAAGAVIEVLETMLANRKQK